MQRITATQRRLDERLDCAERNERLLVPASNADAAALRRRVVTGEIVAPAPGVYARTASWQGLAPDAKALHLIRSLGEKHPTWTFCASSAALAWGLDVPYPLVLPVHARARNQLVRPGEYLRIHIPSREMPAVTHENLRVSPLWNAVLECLCLAPFSYGLAVADSALRATGWTQADLLSFVRTEGKGRHGIRHALITASHADGRAENGGESRARAFFIARGFQLPELQVEIPDPTDPAHTFRADFHWLLPDGREVLGEFDGLEKYRDPAMLAGRTTLDALVAERQRESRLSLAGYPVLRFTYDDLRNPQKLEQLLTVAGIPRNEATARAWHDAWTGRR